MKFDKMQGAGNDYVYVNAIEEHIENPEELAVRIADRHYGVGGDGLILICPSDVADFKMRMFNNDGSEGMMCGNGIRCVAKFCYDHKLTDKTEINIDTLSGVKSVKLLFEEGQVTGACVDMGRASFEREDIPYIDASPSLIGAEKAFGGEKYIITCVSMGNPHCVIFCDDCGKIELEKIGAIIENDAMFPDKANVEFVQLMGENEIKVRVWERGTGVTLACGTGACACAAAAVRLGICEMSKNISVSLPGGTLLINCGEDYSIKMTGGAVRTFSGECDI